MIFQETERGVRIGFEGKIGERLRRVRSTVPYDRSIDHPIAIEKNARAARRR